MEVVFLGGHVFHKIIFLVNSYVFCLICMKNYDIYACRKYLSSLKKHQFSIMFLEKKLPWHPYRSLRIVKGPFISAKMG